MDILIPARAYRGLIPTHRGVCGSDLLDLRERLNLDLGDILWMLGIQQSRYSKLVGKNQLIPLTSAPRTFMVRLLDEASVRNEKVWTLPPHLMQYPIPYPRSPTIDEYFKLCQVYDVQPAMAVIMLGLTAHSLKRWRRIQSHGEVLRMAPVIDRLIMMLYLEMTMRGREAIYDHLNRLRIEAEARNVNLYDVLVGEASWADIFDREDG